MQHIRLPVHRYLDSRTWRLPVDAHGTIFTYGVGAHDFYYTDDGTTQTLLARGEAIVISHGFRAGRG